MVLGGGGGGGIVDNLSGIVDNLSGVVDDLSSPVLCSIDPGDQDASYPLCCAP